MSRIVSLRGLRRTETEKKQHKYSINYISRNEDESHRDPTGGRRWGSTKGPEDPRLGMRFDLVLLGNINNYRLIIVQWRNS